MLLKTVLYMPSDSFNPHIRAKCQVELLMVHFETINTEHEVQSTKLFYILSILDYVASRALCMHGAMTTTRTRKEQLFWACSISYM